MIKLKDLISEGKYYGSADWKKMVKDIVNYKPAPRDLQGLHKVIQWVFDDSVFKLTDKNGKYMMDDLRKQPKLKKLFKEGKLTEAVKPSDLRYKLLRDLSKKFEVKGLSAASHRGKLTINGVPAATGGGGGTGVELDLHPKGAKQKKVAKEVMMFAKKWFKKYKFKNDPQKSRLHGNYNVWMNDDWNLAVMFGKSHPSIMLRKGNWF